MTGHAPGPDPKLYTVNGVTRTLDEWATYTGLSRQGILQRLRAGWPIERALSLADQRGKGSVARRWLGPAIR